MARGSKPGERRGGRQKGVKNATTMDIKAVAALHGKAAIDKLVSLMNGADSEQVQVAAAREILDRAYGKAVQAIEGNMNVHVSHEEVLAKLENAAFEPAAVSDAAYH